MLEPRATLAGDVRAARPAVDVVVPFAGRDDELRDLLVRVGRRFERGPRTATGSKRSSSRAQRPSSSPKPRA